MDYGSYLQLKMRATNNYKSNWQARDASEVTMRNQSIATANVSSTHQGPDDHCIPCTKTLYPVSSTNPPNNGHSKDYGADYTIGMKYAGQAACNDPVWGTAGGVNLKSQAEITALSAIPLNPVSSTGGGYVANDQSQAVANIVQSKCLVADPGVKIRPIQDPTQSGLFPSG